jgi:signal transduction histidine kinase
VVGGLVILFVYFSFRSLLKKRRALEDLRTRIARDIHDEIGSGLGTISLLSRMAQEGDLDDAKEDLKEIYRISVSMSEAMRDIVWFNRTDVDTVRDLLMRMRETADGMMAKHNSFNFETFGEGLVRPISMEIRREIFLIFKEALHNILKHANAQRVDVRAGLEGNEFILSIRDDGKGFDKLRETSGAGMGSMKKRAESLRGSLSLESTPGAGTSLNLRAKLK